MVLQNERYETRKLPKTMSAHVLQRLSTCYSNIVLSDKFSLHSTFRKGLQKAQQKSRMLFPQSSIPDVVESCKNLMKEKSALEESVKVLTQPTGEVVPNTLSEFESSVAIKHESDGPFEEKDNSDLESLKNSLRTLTLEKTRIESELKFDRKRILRENEELQKKINDQQCVWNEEKVKLENLVEKLRKQVREQQMDRDKEQLNQSLMLKELQGLVADERCAKEKLEQQLENLKMTIEKLPDRRLEYERHINELHKELQSTRDMLEAAEGEKNDLPSLLQQLQQQMDEMKARHQEAVDREIKRANEAEAKLKALASASEERSATLEQRLSELSQMVGSYDKLRQQDQMAIQNLKDRVAQLDQENTALARAVTNPEKSFDLGDDKQLDTQVIMEHIAKLKDYLRIAKKKSKRINLSGILTEIQRECDSNIHATCQDEIKQLREELERYRLNEELMKNKHEIEVDNSTELNFLKKQVSNLQNELQSCRAQQKLLEEQLQASEQNLSAFIKDLTSQHKHELSAQRSECQAKMLELELQLQKQRERSMSLIEDKDKEIEFLKLQIEKHPFDNQVKDHESDKSELQQLPSSSDPVYDLISTSKKGKQILHYAQEMCRKDVEISNLRRNKLHAESALRELQQISALKDEMYKNEIDIMKSQIKRLESIEKGVNMEYLKNVVLRFIESSKTSDRSHMLNAIASILHFTVVELEEARDHLHMF